MMAALLIADGTQSSLTGRKGGGSGFRHGESSGGVRKRERTFPDEDVDLILMGPIRSRRDDSTPRTSKVGVPFLFPG